MNQIARMKFPVLALAALVFSAAAMAGPKHRDEHGRMGPPSAERQLAHLEEALDLTAEQSEELLAVLLVAEEERRAIHESIMEQARPQICANMTSTHDNIVAVLTPEQAEEFEALMEARKDRAGRHARRGGFGDLDCSDDPS